MTIQSNSLNRIFIILFPLVLIIILSCSSEIDTQKSAVDPLQYVDLFICTEGDNGELYPGPAYPFGMVHLSPETEGKSHVGYNYEDEFIEGFSNLRIGGGGSRGQ